MLKAQKVNNQFTKIKQKGHSRAKSYLGHISECDQKYETEDILFDPESDQATANMFRTYQQSLERAKSSTYSRKTFTKPFMNKFETRSKHNNSARKLQNRPKMPAFSSQNQSDDFMFTRLSYDLEHSLCANTSVKGISGKISYDTMVQTLFELGFVVPVTKQSDPDVSDYEYKLINKIWRHLRGHKNQLIVVQNLKIYLAAIMGLKYDWMIKSGSNSGMII